MSSLKKNTFNAMLHIISTPYQVLKIKQFFFGLTLKYYINQQITYK